MKFKIVILLLFSFYTLFSQTLTKEETIFFDKYKKDSVQFDLIKGLVLIDSSFTNESYLKNKTILDNFIKTLPKKEKSEKREKKRVKKIYDLIHKKFFKKYDGKVFFNDIFISKTYNCVTATALYVYVFDEVEIPYHIKELPSHVFLIAYPNKYKIHLETTVPGVYGFYIPKDSEVTKIINELIETKQLTTEEEEVESKGYNESYMDFFYGEEHIYKSKLIGMQYYNKAILNYNDQDFDAAFDNINKSFVFYKNPYSKPLLLGIINQVIQKMDFNDSNSINTIFNAVQLLDDSEIKEPFINSILYKFVNNDKTDLIVIENSIPYFKTIKNEKIKNICLYFLNDYLAVENLTKNNFEKSLLFSEILYENDKDNKQIKEMITYALVKKHYLLKINEESIQSLNKYRTKYPFLNDDKRYITLVAGFYATVTQNNYRLRNEQKGYQYYSNFDQLISNKKDLVQINPEMIAELYIIAGKFYYGSNKFKKAKEIFERGLNYYPEHLKLTKLLKWTIEDMKDYKD